MSRVGKFGRVIVTAVDGGSLLRTAIWDQIVQLEAAVLAITVEHEGMQFQYQDVCAKWDGRCR